MSHSLVKARSAKPLLMMATFLTRPLRTSGTKKLRKWMFPMALTSVSSRMILVSSPGLSPLHIVSDTTR